MIHVVTAANRSLYANELREMHRLRWQYYIEERAWSGLAALQTEPGFERDFYDDERAVYLLALSPEGALQGSMRLRPTDGRSILLDCFPDLALADSGFKPSADVWEITRLMRAPQYRGGEGELRLKINCAAAEFGLTRGIRRFVAVMDTFLLPATRQLMRGKHRVLGLPQNYAEGEMIAIEYCADAEWLAGVRAFAKFSHPMMYEAPPPAADASPLHSVRLVQALHALTPDDANALADWLKERGAAPATVAA